MPHFWESCIRGCAFASLHLDALIQAMPRGVHLYLALHGCRVSPVHNAGDMYTCWRRLPAFATRRGPDWCACARQWGARSSSSRPSCGTWASVRVLHAFLIMHLPPTCPCLHVAHRLHSPVLTRRHCGRLDVGCVNCPHAPLSCVRAEGVSTSAGLGDLHSFAFLGGSGRIGAACDWVWFSVPQGPQKQIACFLHACQARRAGRQRARPRCNPPAPAGTRMPERVTKEDRTHRACLATMPAAGADHRQSVPLGRRPGMFWAGVGREHARGRTFNITACNDQRGAALLGSRIN